MMYKRLGFTFRNRWYGVTIGNENYNLPGPFISNELLSGLKPDVIINKGITKVNTNMEYYEEENLK